jgi:hypothetical protein
MKNKTGNAMRTEAPTSPGTKKTAKQSPRKAEQTDYRAWKAHAAALLERQGISAGVMRERYLWQLFISGATPERAAGGPSPFAIRYSLFAI